MDTDRVGTLLVIGTLWGVHRMRSAPVDDAPPARTTAVEGGTTRERPEPEAPPIVVAAPAEDPAQDEADVVYDCSTPGTRVYSDMPCRPGAKTRRLAPSLSVFKSPPLPRATSRPAVPEQARSVVITEVDDANSGACDQLFAEKDRLDSMMRAGYGAERGERLRAAHHRVTDRLRDLDCRLFH